MKKKLFINAIVIALLGLILTSCSSTVEVKFIGSNGEVISVENVDKNSTITEPSDPKVNGYTFDGWYSDLSCTTEYDFSAVIDKETSVYAKLTPIQYNITYVLDGGVASDNMVSTYNIETKVDLGVPTKANFVFVGWYTSATEGTKVNSITKGNIGDITLYARWNQDIYVTSILLPNSFVSFNQNSGERDQERVEFFDLNKTYKVGDDNNFKFIPEVEFSSYDSENDEFTPAVVEQWTYQLSLFEKDGENFVAVNNESYVDSFNVVTCEVNFNENSVGKTLKVVVTPDGLTAKQKTSIENWQVS